MFLKHFLHEDHAVTIGLIPLLQIIGAVIVQRNTVRANRYEIIKVQKTTDF